MEVLKKNKVEEFVSNIANENLLSWDKFGGARNLAKKVLEELDFPTTRNEYWKYSRTSKITKHNYSFYNKSELKVDLNKVRIDNLDTYEIVFINGFISLENSNLPTLNELEIVTLRDSESKAYDNCFAKNLDTVTNVFSALNTAYFTDGVLIKAKATIEKPIHIVNFSTGEKVISQPRNLFVTEKSCSVTIIESSINENTSDFFQNKVNEFFLEENSQLNYYTIQNFENGLNTISTNVVNQEDNSIFTSFVFTLKGDWIRNNTNVFVNGENCESNLYSAYKATGSQQIDNHTIVDHRVPNCESNELYKGTIDDKATVTFNGKVFVRQDAQKINAFQSNNNILLSDDATINSKPELEIYADDVKCSHGSTTGQLDEDALFYLQSRGLSKKGARKLLVGAFVGEVIENIKIDSVKEHVKVLYGIND